MAKSKIAALLTALMLFLLPSQLVFQVNADSDSYIEDEKQGMKSFVLAHEMTE